MLTLLVSPDDRDRTRALLDEIEDRAKDGARSLLLVPEQASFSYEKRIARMKNGAAFVTAVSFSRLAQLILREQGGDGRARLTETAQFFLMNLALEEVSDALTVYRRNYRSRGFLSQMLGVAAECADAGITPEALSRFSFSQPQGTLRDKSYELSLILDAYNAVVHRSYQSEEDELTAAAKKIFEWKENTAPFVFVDGFYGFTASEYRLLEALLSRSEKTTVALCAVGENRQPPAFRYSGDTMVRLTRIARQAGQTVEIHPLAESGGRRLPREFLDAMREDTVLPAQRRFSQICVSRPDNPAQEAEETAAKIARLVREDGYRWRDIAIVMRTEERWKTLLPAALRRCGVPYFFDVRGEALSGALLCSVQAAVLLAAGDRDGDPVALLRSPVFGISALDAAETENYCYVWSPRPSEWDAPFLNHPDGMTARWTDGDTARLARINACREKIAEPVRRLRGAIKSGSGRRFAKGMVRFLDEISAKENLIAFSAQMEENPRREFLAQQSLLWDALMEVLDLFASEGMQEGTLTPQRITELFELSLSAAQVALPPRTLDEVAVGCAGRMRIEDAKVVFLIGAVQGEFPACHTPGGLLTDSERRSLIENGMTLLGDSDRFLDNERQTVYAAAAAATDLLFVSCARCELTGEALIPSELFERAAAFALPGAPLPFAQVVTPETALLCYASEEKHTPQAQALRSLCTAFGKGNAADAIDSAARRTHKIEDSSLAKRLFGDRMRLSPTRLEQYYRCPYSYFVQNGLFVRALKKAELSPVQAGTLIHRVLERVVSRYGGAALCALSDETLKAEIRAETQAYLLEIVRDESAVTDRMRHSLDRIGEWLLLLLRRLGEEFSHSLFEPAAFELPIREGEAVEPIRLETADGCEVLVQGTVDRVDTAIVNGKKYVRVVDYKSGGKLFCLQDVYYGLNLQMLLYLFSIWENGTGALENTLPAGVLYLPALGKYTSGTRDGEAAQRDLEKQYRMNGLLLHDPDVLAAMETDGRAIFIPVRPDTKKSEALATLAQMGRLRRLAEKKLTDMAEMLREGKIPACPADTGDDPCRFCDYKSVCGFEAGDPVRELVRVPREAILGEEDETDGICTDA